MNNKKNIIFSLIAITIIILLAILSPKISQNKKSTEKVEEDQELFTRAVKESNNIPDNEKKEFSNISVDSYLIIAHNENKSLVLIGRSGCQYCKIAEPIIQKLMKDNDLTIYYVSTDDFDDDSYRKFSESNDLLKSFATPFLMVVSNDEIIDYEEGLLDTDSYKKFLVKNGFITEKEN